MIAENKILLFILGFLVLTVIGFAIYFRRKYQRPTDYKALFILGVAFIAIGTTNNSLLPVGIVFMLIGLKHRSRWEENRLKWSQLSPEEKKFKIIFLTLIGLALISTLVILFINPD